MKNLKKIFVLLLLGVMVTAITVGAKFTPTTIIALADAENDMLPPYKKTYNYNSSERGVDVKLDYSVVTGLYGDMKVEMLAETDEEILKRFEKYCKKKIDSGDIGEVIYVTTSLTDDRDKEQPRGTYRFTVKVPKFYKNKDVAVIPFNDYRTPQTLKDVEVNDEGYIKFTGNSSAYAYAIVYNGVYKDIILIAIILLSVLVICVTVKIICVRRDNPIYKEKKREKAIAKKKTEHKQNRRLQKELKREKEKLKKK